jgi:hypothetical protein
MTDPRHEPIPEPARAQVEAAILRDDPDELARAVIGAALHADDGAWAEEVCVRLASHPHPNVRGNAVLGLGHVARVHASLDRGRALPILEAALGDADEYVRGQAHAAVDDVEHFLGWRTSRPNPLRDWHDGLGVDGIGYALNDAVAIVDGEHAGEAGSVVMLLAWEPEPLYVVEFATGEDARVPQSALRPA